MAYSIGDRFPRTPHSYRLLEPCAYQSDGTHTIKANKAPFLSKAERKTQSGNRIWTHAIYHADPRRKIPNCATLMSKIPRFPYEALSKEDLEDILCRCGLQNVCECPDDNEQEIGEICHAKLPRRLYKGPPPKAVIQGLSVPSRRDHGFEKMPDGTHKRIYKVESNVGPPLYEAEAIESNAFYRGCKWSKWTSSRAMKDPETWPGPADYNLEKLPTEDEICMEKVREQKRKHSKQFRYIEMVQRKNLIDRRPGPAHYSPRYPKDPELRHLGPKAVRFNNFDERKGPGPADHWIKRDFDLPVASTTLCHAKLPEPAFFGVKAKRFKPHKEEGPSPATYSPNNKQCRLLNCSPPPFGTSAQRFKETVLEVDESDGMCGCGCDTIHKICPKPTWEFKSKTIRMKPLEKKQFEQSPADLPMEEFYPERASQLQYLSPFCSSEGRFQPWYNWLSVLGRVKTPGPGFYNSEKHRCLPAVSQGPIIRSERFPACKIQNPAPNEYRVGGGLETILATHNQRLKNNIENQHKYFWEPHRKLEILSLKEQEALILKKAIASLNVDSETEFKSSNDVKETISSEEAKPAAVTTGGVQPKLLRCFLYNHQVKPTF